MRLVRLGTLIEVEKPPQFPGGAFDRRHFLTMLAAAGLAGCSSSSSVSLPSLGDDEPPEVEGTASSLPGLEDPTGRVQDLEVPDAPFDRNPFTLGVASGDPNDSSVILWTRLAPDPLRGGGAGEEPVEVLWEMASDRNFSTMVVNGLATATPGFAHSLHIDVGDLEADSEFFYRFRVGAHTSAVGATRTTPAPRAVISELRLAVASCQNWQAGYYNAYAHMVEEDLDLIVFVGDYIYEAGDSGDEVRPHGTNEISSLDEYRNRYALYRTDPLLQQAHAKCPWLVTWDDHEVENNYAGDTDENGSRIDLFLNRRAAAYQAYYEHMPLRLPPPDRADFQIYRSVQWGSLAKFLMLDTRQYRDDQACPPLANLPVAEQCAEMLDPTRSMLGSEQLLWMADELGRSATTWNVLAQQVMMAPVQIPVAGSRVVNPDQWDGYPGARRRVMEILTETGARNPIVFTGDIHLAAVADLTSDPENPSSPVLATEFVCTGLTSPFPSVLSDVVANTISRAPNVRYAEPGPRGYLSCTITPTQWSTEFRYVESVTTEGAPLVDGPVWTVTAGVPGANSE